MRGGLPNVEQLDVREKAGTKRVMKRITRRAFRRWLRAHPDQAPRHYAYRGYSTVLILLALLGAGVAHAQEDPGPTVEVGAGAGGVTGNAATVVPTATVVAEGPLGNSDDYAKAALRALVRVTFSGLPDSNAVDLGDVRTFDSIEAVGELRLPVSCNFTKTSIVSLVARGQFATKLSKDPEPSTRHPRAYGLGVAVERRDEDGSILQQVEVIVGRSEIASPQEWGKGQVILEGQVRLVDVKGVRLNLRVESHLNLSRSTGPHARDVTRAWAEAAYGWGG